MYKSEKLNEIQKLWESKVRETGSGQVTKWKDLKWGSSLKCESSIYNLNDPNLLNRVRSNGHHLWAWGCREEASGVLTWDWALLHQLYSWYCLPDDDYSPFFVDEHAMVVCIPAAEMASTLSGLFDGPEATLLGMGCLQQWQVENDRSGRESSHSSRAVSIDKTPLAFLAKYPTNR